MRSEAISKINKGICEINVKMQALEGNRQGQLLNVVWFAPPELSFLRDRAQEGHKQLRLLNLKLS